MIPPAWAVLLFRLFTTKHWTIFYLSILADLEGLRGAKVNHVDQVTRLPVCLSHAEIARVDVPAEEAHLMHALDSFQLIKIEQVRSKNVITNKCFTVTGEHALVN